MYIKSSFHLLRAVKLHLKLSDYILFSSEFTEQLKDYCVWKIDIICDIQLGREEFKIIYNNEIIMNPFGNIYNIIGLFSP